MNKRKSIYRLSAFLLSVVFAVSVIGVYKTNAETWEEWGQRRADREQRQANMSGLEKFQDDLKNGIEDFTSIFKLRDDPRTADPSQQNVNNFAGEQTGNVVSGLVSAGENQLEKMAANAAQKATTEAAKNQLKNIENVASKGPAGKALSAVDSFQRITEGHKNKHNHSSMAFVSTAGNYFVAGANFAPGGDAISQVSGVAVDAIAGDSCASKLNGKTNDLLDLADIGADLVNGMAIQMMGGRKCDWRKILGFGDTSNLYAPRTAIKPNIYLYPEDDQTVTVTFEDPELLKTVIPDYDGNWTVIAHPDGKLDYNGEEYGYLFYECFTMTAFMQRDEAWIVPENDREDFFTGIAEGYGFNAQETEDFVTFWCSRLPEGESYVMYPQLTGIIDKEMPVHVNPAPESVFRVWFLYVPVGQFDDAEIAAINEPGFDEQVIRKGYTLVEWGGIVEE